MTPNQAAKEVEKLANRLSQNGYDFEGHVTSYPKTKPGKPSVTSVKRLRKGVE